ncbi:hypothetical protein M427DRAFT_363728 [Gonapodya prolifera JEL478]|uniref:FAD-binding FR-type domain-containing protein n=1 Tax=Gonapodya prolifera (strain JEL478) TaxID=1344416 RepID=A0A139ABL0_GONPJ|nr:hypothetical protein M427DRAFT_363728 [Gonapodya prolifera JEL478]|eukprot:KXS13803.1 hypothetical protein M427DRAFT_363728 [Gonapodya prolifera JEL478]
MSAVLIGFLLIPTSKNSVIAHYLRLPYTTTVRLHRWIGWTLAFSSCLHLALSMMWKAIDVTPLYQLFFTLPANTKWGSEKYRYVTAFPALLFLGIVVIMALPYVRRNFYNAFIISHLFGIPFMAFAYFHNSIDIYFAIPALLLYAVDLALRFGAWFTLTPVTTVSHEESGYKVVTVPFTKPVLPGQFMRVVVPAASRWEAHPWSVTSTTPGSVKFLVGPVKGKNEWTERVFQYLESTKSGGSASVSLQGPYGNPVLFATEEQRHDAYVFLVAGSGVSPAIAAIEHLLNRFFEDGSLQSAHGKIQLVWSTGRASPERLTSLAQWLDKESPVQVTIHDTAVERMDQASEGVVRRGRLNARHVMHKVVDAAVSWSEAGGAPRVAVFVCGPGSFAGQVVADLTSVEKERGVRFSTHVESFEM